MHFSERMREVIIENRDWRWVIEYFDAPDALFYCDPPYPKKSWDSKSKAYTMLMEDNEHEELLEILNNIQGMAIISGYDNELYQSKLQNWNRLSKMDMNQKSKASEECIWLSPKIAQHLNMQNSLLAI